MPLDPQGNSIMNPQILQPTMPRLPQPNNPRFPQQGQQQHQQIPPQQNMQRLPQNNPQHPSGQQHPPNTRPVNPNWQSTSQPASPSMEFQSNSHPRFHQPRPNIQQNHPVAPFHAIQQGGPRYQNQVISSDASFSGNLPQPLIPERSNKPKLSSTPYNKQMSQQDSQLYVQQQQGWQQQQPFPSAGNQVQQQQTQQQQPMQPQFQQQQQQRLPVQTTQPFCEVKEKSLK